MTDEKAIWRAIQTHVGVTADGDPGPATAQAIAKALGMTSAPEPKRMSAAGIALLKQSEGLALKAYRCPADVLTIGYGHTGGVSAGQIITEARADELLREDLAKFEAGVAKLAPVTTQGQFDALVDFAFNLGLANLDRSTLLKLHNDGDHAGAARQFGLWVYAGGTELSGLAKRRAAEKRLYEAAP